jgi:hypothetical protein
MASYIKESAWQRSWALWLGRCHRFNVIQQHAAQETVQRCSLKWTDSYSIDLALRSTEFAPTGAVKSAACIFCETCGREDSTALHDESALPLSTEEEVRSRQRRKTTKTQHWTNFRGDTIQKHHREQHARKWAEYLALLRKKQSEPEPL